MTKWEQYAKTKNIKKRKRGQMVWDDDVKVCIVFSFRLASFISDYHLFHMSQEWKPRWGYKKAYDDKRDWMLEVPDNAG